jgi:hypothetical protein
MRSDGDGKMLLITRSGIWTVIRRISVLPEANSENTSREYYGVRTLLIKRRPSIIWKPIFILMVQNYRVSRYKKNDFTNATLIDRLEVVDLAHRYTGQRGIPWTAP